MSLPNEPGDWGAPIARHRATPSVWRTRAAERILRWRRPCVSWRVHPVHRRARAPWERAQRRWRSSRLISRRPRRGGDATVRRVDSNAAAALRLCRRVAAAALRLAAQTRRRRARAGGGSQQRSYPEGAENGNLRKLKKNQISLFPGHQNEEKGF